MMLFADGFSNALAKNRLGPITCSQTEQCLQEYPSIRFRAAKPGEDGMTEVQSLVSQRIAVSVEERMTALQRSGQVPTSESCELIITDRSDSSRSSWHSKVRLSRKARRAVAHWSKFSYLLKAHWEAGRMGLQ